MSEASEKKDNGRPERPYRAKPREVNAGARKKPAAHGGASGKGHYDGAKARGGEDKPRYARVDSERPRRFKAAGTESADVKEAKNGIEVIEEDGEFTEERRARDESEVRHVFRAGSEKKLLSLLGFAARGRKLICGTDLCRDSIRRDVAIITIVASDASENTKKRIIDACRYYGSDMCVAPVASAELSHMIGKTGEIMVISVTDRHFADGIAALFEDGGTN